MKLSISNIGWSAADDEIIYEELRRLNVEAIEIAPTRIFPEDTYLKLEEAKELKKRLKSQYGLSISSMQSIWYGKTENIFRSNREREVLFEYTKLAIKFASVLECKNLVFGCPKNRVIYNEKDYITAMEFFYKLGEYAYQNNTVLSLEPNPVIYNTNFINTTEDALLMVKQIKSKGFRVNLDTGTMICNNENFEVVKDNIDLIHHIHISEPHLQNIQRRKLHNQLAELLSGVYHNYISLEMGKRENNKDILESIEYMKEVFDGI